MAGHHACSTSYVKPGELRIPGDQLSVFRNNIDERLKQTPPCAILRSCCLFRFRNRVPEMRELFGKGFSINLDPSFTLNPSGGTTLERDKNDSRRSTRLSRQIAITITSLDPACDLRVECKTVVVNADGCAVIVREHLEKDKLVIVTLVSNGQSKEGRVVLGIPLNENASWLTGLEFDSPSNFWEIENPPADWPV